METAIDTVPVLALLGAIALALISGWRVWSVRRWARVLAQEEERLATEVRLSARLAAIRPRPPSQLATLQSPVSAPASQLATLRSPVSAPASQLVTGAAEPGASQDDAGQGSDARARLLRDATVALMGIALLLFAASAGWLPGLTGGPGADGPSGAATPPAATFTLGGAAGPTAPGPSLPLTGGSPSASSSPSLPLDPMVGPPSSGSNVTPATRSPAPAQTPATPTSQRPFRTPSPRPTVRPSAVPSPSATSTSGLEPSPTSTPSPDPTITPQPAPSPDPTITPQPTPSPEPPTPSPVPTTSPEPPTPAP